MRDPHCRLCGAHPEIHTVANPETLATITCESTRSTMQSITTTELRAVLGGQSPGLLLDVREPHEHAIARIEGSRLIPLSTLPGMLDQLPRNRDIYVHCKSGMRSAKAVGMLLERGFTRVKNVTGGIDAWLAEG